MPGVKILAVTSRFPYPIERGDKLRAFHQLRALSAHHDIALVALSERRVPQAHLDQIRPWCSSVEVVHHPRRARLVGLAAALSTGRPLQVGYFNSPALVRQVSAAIDRERPDHLYCQLIRTASCAHGVDVPSTIDYQDAFGAATRRRADKAAWYLRPLLSYEAARTVRHERRVADWFDHRVIISAQDRDLLDLPRGTSVDVVPNGVDTGFFRATEPPGVRRDLVFVGNMGYAPNVLAATVLVEEILPAVQAVRPDTDLLLAGARPARAVQRLAGASVEVSGWVDDIRDAYARGRVMVAPLQIGAGQQNKILEAMAMGVPCVTTELVNRAIGATPGRELLVGRDATELADCALELLEDEARRRDMATAARRFVEERYSWASVGGRLAEVFRRSVG